MAKKIFSFDENAKSVLVAAKPQAAAAATNLSVPIRAVSQGLRDLKSISPSTYGALEQMLSSANAVEEYGLPPELASYAQGGLEQLVSAPGGAEYIDKQLVNFSTNRGMGGTGFQYSSAFGEGATVEIVYDAGGEGSLGSEGSLSGLFDYDEEGKARRSVLESDEKSSADVYYIQGDRSSDLRVVVHSNASWAAATREWQKGALGGSGIQFKLDGTLYDNEKLKEMASSLSDESLRKEIIKRLDRDNQTPAQREKANWLSMYFRHTAPTVELAQSRTYKHQAYGETEYSTEVAKHMIFKKNVYSWYSLEVRQELGKYARSKLGEVIYHFVDSYSGDQRREERKIDSSLVKMKKEMKQATSTKATSIKSRERYEHFQSKRRKEYWRRHQDKINEMRAAASQMQGKSKSHIKLFKEVGIIPFNLDIDGLDNSNKVFTRSQLKGTGVYKMLDKDLVYAKTYNNRLSKVLASDKIRPLIKDRIARLFNMQGERMVNALQKGSLQAFNRFEGLFADSWRMEVNLKGLKPGEAAGFSVLNDAKNPETFRFYGRDLVYGQPRGIGTGIKRLKKWVKLNILSKQIKLRKRRVRAGRTLKSTKGLLGLSEYGRTGRAGRNLATGQKYAELGRLPASEISKKASSILDSAQEAKRQLARAKKRQERALEESTKFIAGADVDKYDLEVKAIKRKARPYSKIAKSMAAAQQVIEEGKQSGGFLSGRRTVKRRTKDGKIRRKTIKTKGTFAPRHKENTARVIAYRIMAKRFALGSQGHKRFQTFLNAIYNMYTTQIVEATYKEIYSIFEKISSE